jgi:regulator of nucleoside diphosphate kinase
MHKKNNGLVLRKDDYEIILSFLRGWHCQTSFDRRNVEELGAELKKAKVVEMENFPQDMVRLNSKVKIAVENKESIRELTLVTPDKADIRKGKISVIAPVGTALIGFRRVQKIAWQVPAGKKTFTIIDVVNQYG